jgi:hypothetical protein
VAAQKCRLQGSVPHADTSAVSTQTAVWIAFAAVSVIAGVAFWLGIDGGWLTLPKKFGIWLALLSFVAGFAFGWRQGALLPFFGLAAYGATGLLLHDQVGQNVDERGLYFLYFGYLPLVFAAPAVLGAALRTLMTR